MSQSEIVLFRTKQTLREEAAHLGLTGSAIVARHEVIEARAERAAARIVYLLAGGRYIEAQAQLELPDWSGLETGPAVEHVDAADVCE